MAAAIGLLAWWALRHVEERQIATTVVEPAIVVTVKSTPLPKPIAIDTPAIDSPARFAFVIGADGDQYIRLADDPGVRHGRYRLTDELTAVATVKAKDLPAELRAWQGREVLVDGTCRAKVTDFAMIARVDGWADFAGEAKWTARSVAGAGLSVLAGRLSACTGTWARAAELAPATTLVEVPNHDRTLEHRAMADLFATPFAADLQKQWRDAEQEGDWRLEVNVTTRVYNDPQTQARWVLVHALRTGTCGDFHIDVLAVYRDDGDGLRRVTVHNSELTDIERMVEIDGYLMLVGTTGITSYRAVEDLGGTNKARDEIPFVGCPC